MTTATQKIPSGYKQTDIGVIPADWNVKPIKDLATITTGSKNTQDRIFDGLYPFFVRSQTIERINSYSYDGEAILTAGDGVGTGKVFHYINGKFDIHQRVYKISDFDKKLNGYFFFLYFSNNFFNRIMQMTAKSSVDSVRMEMIADMQIPVPAEAEQVAISTTISDTNTLIEKLEQLIEKKKNIKQGAMQELLTGKRRLPGFNGKWETKKLGELLDYEQPTEYLVKTSDYSDNHSTPVLTAGKTFILGYTAEETGLFQNLPTIIFDDFTTAIKYVDFPFKAKSSAMKMLIPRSKDINLKFVFAKMQMIDFQLGDHKRYWISEYQNIEIATPKPDEQTAITTVLSDMDVEIEKLESRLTKYQNIKQGMMQVLLTGKIRLLSK